MIYQNRSSFVKRDIEILSKDYKISEFKIPVKPKFNVIYSLLALCLKLAFSFYKYDFVICQGGGFQSFPAALVRFFKKYKLIIIAIGTDCAKIPEINYGNFRRPLMAWVTAFSFRMANLIIPVHESLIQKTISYDRFLHPEQGILNLVPGIKTPMIPLHNGYNLDLWKSTKPRTERKRTFLSVSANLNNTTFKLKGFDLIFKLAEEFPKESFSLVGQYSGNETVPENISFLDNMTQSELVDVYNDHKYYLQLSMSEGFPNALCEAMLCGCTPVVSDIGAMPSIVGSEGIILKKRDSSTLHSIIKELLTNTSTYDPAKRIASNYPLINRETELLGILKSTSWH